MPRLKRARRVLIIVAVLLVMAVVGVGVLGVSTVRQSFPQSGGELAIEGLNSSVAVLRDDRGIPTIYADNASDLFRAQGFVSAQDRFFEMDLRRHLTAGRLAEMVGEGGLESDKAVRTMGWRRVAEQELPRLAPETRQYLRAYADGVNAYIAQVESPEKMSLEYTFLQRRNPGYRVEPWTPVDSLAWLKALAWDLRGDYNDELTRARLSRRGISLKQIALLYPPYPFDRHLPILSGEDWAPSAADDAATDQAASAVPAAAPNGRATAPAAPAPATAAPATTAAPAAPAVLSDLRSSDGARAVDAAVAALDAAPSTLGRGDDIGSNSWVVSGPRSTTGKPLLANDPHLALSIPGIWSQVNLQCREVTQACPFRVSGFTFSGVPGVVIGHNDTIAWGMTNLRPDVTDFYLEQVSGDTYLRDGRRVPLEKRQETLKVAGGADVTITVRSTVHGPIMSDVSASVDEAGDRVVVRGAPQSNRYAVSLAWTALTPGTAGDAIFAINAARGWDDFRAAAAQFTVPSQNLVYADTAGHIGYQTPGRIPVRRSATPGSPPGYWPAPGWDSQWDWKGWVAPEDLPHVLDPDEGFVVTANQAVTASTTPFLTTEWDYGFRAQRIRTLLAAKAKVSPQDMSQIQGDVRNTYAPALVERLLAVQVDDFTAQAQRLLRDWDGSQPSDKSRDSASASYYNAVWKHLLDYTFDELPPDLAADGGSRWMIVLEQLLKDPKNDWWDDRTTPGLTEGSGEILKRALVDARLDLARELGKVPAQWRWGRLHQLDLRHPVMGDDSLPEVVRSIFNREGIELGGGNSIVNANSWNAAKPGYDVISGPSMRMVIDMGNLDASTWVNSTGQSGHTYDDHYADQIDAWAAGESFPWPFGETAVREASSDELTLVPPGSPTG